MDIMDINDTTATLTLVADTSNRALIGEHANYISIYNPSSSIAYVKTGDVSVTATTSDAWIPPGQAISFRKEPRNDHIAAICSEGTILNIQAGKGV